MLLFLAPELIQEISDQLPIDDIKRLRLTCKDLGNILASSVWRSFEIDIRGKTLDEAISKLQMLATKTSAASRGTKRLTIKALAPKSDPEYRKPVWIRVDGVWIRDTSPGDPPEVQSAEQEMKKCLYDPVTFLQCVRTVSWIPSGQDDGWTHTRVIDALLNISNLQDLHIDISFCQADVPFHLFKNLRAISISGINNAHHYEKTLDNLAKMIVQSPQLDSISIDYGPPENGNGTGNELPCLRQFFKYYPKDLPPLRLRFLSMVDCPVHFDEITMPHFQYLRSLNWTATLVSHYPSLQASAANLWTTLCYSNIQLEEITVDIIVSEFIDYIGSFSGVRKLSVEAGGLRVPSFDETALPFYSALQRHVQSLEGLRIITYCGGLWCFGPHNSTLISQCLNLEELHVRIAPQDMISTPRPRVIGLLIDTVTTNNPKLDSLQIALAWNDAYRHYIGPNNIERADRQMLSCIENYRAPISCTRLPPLRVGLEGVFVGYLANVANGGELRHRDISCTPSLATGEDRPHQSYYLRK